jgi:hypothetical protein
VYAATGKMIEISDSEDKYWTIQTID